MQRPELEDVESEAPSEGTEKPITTVVAHSPGSLLYNLVLNNVEKKVSRPKLVDYDEVAKKYNRLMLDGLLVFDVPKNYSAGTIFNALRKRGIKHNVDYEMRKALPDELSELEGKRRVVLMRITGARLRKPRW